MTTHQHANNNIHKAEIRKNKAISAIWLIPFIAMCIGLWMVFKQSQSQGPTITISMQSAAGLEINKTKIKTRDIDIGIVTSVVLKKETDGVLITAQIDKDVAHLLTKKTQFWVVSPRISNAGISGLNTLFSGVYIELSPGTDKTRQTHFIALDNPPVTPVGTPGLHITLNSKERIAYSVGDTVLFKGVVAGQFEDVNFDVPNKMVHYNVFIKAPYHELITQQTRFWDVSGLTIDLSANGLSIQSNSLQSLLSNSVAFDEPEGLSNVAKINNRSYFDIYPNKESALSTHFKHSVNYIVLVSDTVRGLNVGAPVEYRGINIGKVLAVNYMPGQHKSLLNEDYKIPVLISIQPGRIGLNDTKQAADQVVAEYAAWIEQGLRAKLKTGNLLTGQLFIELQHYPDESSLVISFFDNHPVIPSMAGDFTLLAQSSEQLLDKLNKLPIEALTSDATTMINTFNEAANTLKNAGTNLTILLDDANKQNLISNLNTTLDATTHLADTYSVGSQSHEDILKALNKLSTLMTAAETLVTGYSKGSETQETLNQTLRGINDLMLEIQPLLLRLNQQPNSLIFSGQHPEDIQPQARK
jgi:paraquat-inducible protein B